MLHLLLLSFGRCFPTDKSKNSVVRDERVLENIPSGKYSYIIQLSDGTTWEQNATSQEVNRVNDSIGTKGIQILGRYSFVDSVTGIKHEVEYEAGKNGYRPKIIMTLPLAVNKEKIHNQPNEERVPVEEVIAATTPNESDDVAQGTTLRGPMAMLRTISASLFSSPADDNH